MSHSTPPADTDVKAFILGTGLFSSLDVSPFTSIDFAAAASAAYELFLTLTNRQFIVGSAASRFYDPPRHPRGLISLKQDLCSDSGSAIVVTVSGTVKVVNVDYYLGPDNADQDGKPWGTIEIPALANCVGWPKRAVEVNGYWGYSRQMGDDVFLAIVKGAAASVAPQLALNVTGGVVEESDEQTQAVYARGNASTLRSEASDWKSSFDEMVNAKKRVLTF